MPQLRSTIRRCLAKKLSSAQGWVSLRASHSGTARPAATTSSRNFGTRSLVISM